jgi:hypothetical protein
VGQFGASAGFVASHSTFVAYTFATVGAVASPFASTAACSVVFVSLMVVPLS